MTDSYRTRGVDGRKFFEHDNGDANGTYSDGVYVMGGLPTSMFSTAPVITVYSPSGTAYLKVTPNAANLRMELQPRTTTHALVYAPLITHKIADTTNTIAAADATDLATSKTAVDELFADVDLHVASTTYHQIAGTLLVPGHKTDDATNTASSADMSDLASGYTLADELDDDINAHIASTTFHQSATAAQDFGGTPDSEPTLTTKVNLIRTFLIAHCGSSTVHTPADVINEALVTATTPGSSEATTQTLINLLKAYWNSHCAVGDATADDLAGVVVHTNALKTQLLAHFTNSATVHGGTADATNLATLTAVAAASDQSTANTLITAEKATFNAHCAVLDGGAYATLGSGQMPMVYPSLGSIWVKTDNSGGVFTTLEYRG